MLRKTAIGLGIDRLIRSRFGGVGAMIMMHRVRTPEPNRWEGNPGLSLAPTALESMIHLLRSEGYELVSLDEAHRRLTDHSDHKTRFACLTFDDGYRDNYDALFPILKQQNAPAAIYVATGFIDGDATAWWYGVEEILNRDDELVLEMDASEQSFTVATLEQRQQAYDTVCSTLRNADKKSHLEAIARMERRYDLDMKALSQEAFLTPSMVRELAEHPLVTIAGHTITHPSLRGMKREEAHREIAGGRQRLQEMTEQPVDHFAFPYGDEEAVDAGAIEVARSVGFKTTTMAVGGPIQRNNDLAALPRIAFDAEDDLIDLRVRLSGLGPALRRLRR
ncbi:MAG: polysaccharide deacetylase family protein [Magnetococcales bacterium]|nr:polysaccharide deacetylase family protein [Magnetococcales bacterium]